MQFYTKRTVEEQENRLPYELRNAYLNSQLDRITIFDGTQELEITGYAEYSYLDEKSYKTQPVRTQDGAIQEIDEYATFSTPRLIIKYNMMGIEDYRSLMKMLKRRNGFIIKCYDVVEDNIAKNEMYFAPPSMPIIYQQYLIALGIKEYAIELIGTNARSKIGFHVDNTKFETTFGNTWEEVADEQGLFSIVKYDDKDVVSVFLAEYGADGVVVRDSYNPLTTFVSPKDFVYNEKVYYFYYV